MTNAYRLYERLGEKEGESGELSALALSIARDVHEVKKDNLRIIRGIEGEVEEVYDQEQMEFQDLMHILENSTRRMLGENRASIPPWSAGAPPTSPPRSTTACCPS